MGEDEGERIRARREFLGWNRSGFAREVGVNRDTLAAIEGGKGYQAATMAKILKGLDRLEVEAGLHAPAQTEGATVEFEIFAADGVRMVARGPITPELKQMVADLVRDVRTPPSEG